MEKVESALDVLSRAATMVQPCPAYPNSDSEGFEHELANNINIKSSSTKSFFLGPTDHVEVEKIISNLKHNSAPGWDNVSNRLLKTCSCYLSRPIAFIINLSLSSGVVPANLKMANVCPIYKSGDKNDVTNYRPISLLTSLSKILEKVVNNQLLKFLEKESLLHDHQFGFRRGRSTEDAVANLVDHVAKKLDSGERCVGVFLDLAKAFDTVSRPILLKKMASYGIQGLALDWFRSYLSDRKQRIGINNTFSELKTIGFGVPQGSVLGPTLFLLYINDLNQISLPNATTFSFADDTAVIFHGHSWEDVVALAELGMRRIATWLQCNLLTLNATKTKYLAFHITERTAPTKTINIKIHQCSRDRAGSPCNCPQLERVSYLKYLGVVLDDRLVWDKQIEAVRGRIRKLTFCFKQLKMIANKDLIRLTYTALVQSILTYCIVVWGGAGVSYMIAAERAQRFVLKVAYRKPFRYPTEHLYHDCEVLNAIKDNDYKNLNFKGYLYLFQCFSPVA
ncbi:unnamed protein product [Plutella xylostella]|uniref:(diamondback moth) hypothetical protein n=1 Tax=Plutella xylostella TaxID=51655 RepID=A0A8S4EJJ8_PLUXY|nr:unnamed protein product [Plutella xylostella]